MHIQQGYNSKTKTLCSGDIEPDIPLNEALELLRDLLKDFSFNTPADKARAYAFIITPMLELSGLLPGRSPLFFIEANDSQSGKGFLIKIVAAIFGCTVATITTRTGVGGIQESFDASVLNGSIFLSLDNYRGLLDEQGLESYFTEDSYLCRMPYRAPVTVSTRARIISLTSNGAILTKDMGNRSCIIRICKQPENYVFANYPEGDILQHVRANQPKYLGAIFSIVKNYCPNKNEPLRKTTATSHSFRGWAQSLDFIVQELCGQAPLLDGHQAEKLRMGNPESQWLRDLCLAVLSTGRREQLYVHKLADIAYQNGMDIPGLKGCDFSSATDDDRKHVYRQIGRRLSAAISVRNEILVDNMRILRTEHQEQGSSDRLRTVRKYQFFKLDTDVPQMLPQTLPQIVPPQDIEDIDKTGKVLKDEISNELGVTGTDVTPNNLKVSETSMSSAATKDKTKKLAPDLFGE